MKEKEVYVLSKYGVGENKKKRLYAADPKLTQLYWTWDLSEACFSPTKAGIMALKASSPIYRGSVLHAIPLKKAFKARLKGI